MKIKKTYQGSLSESKILNTYNNSNKDTYSCDYINNQFKDVVLMDTPTGTTPYSHILELSDDALKFRELIVITSLKQADNQEYTAYSLKIIGNTIYSSGGGSSGYRWVDVTVLDYDQETKKLKLGTIRWTNSSNNAGFGIRKIVGRY